MPKRAILEVVEHLGGVHISTARNQVLNNEQELKVAYNDKVELRTGIEKWRFVRDFNCLVSGNSNMVSAIDLVQKNLVDS